jgi:hypothetical protein
VWTAPLPEYTGSGSYSACDEEGCVRALLAARLLLGPTAGRGEGVLHVGCVVVGTKQSERAFGRARSGCFERLAGVFASRADGSDLQSWGNLNFVWRLTG